MAAKSAEFAAAGGQVYVEDPTVRSEPDAVPAAAPGAP
jgi:hypothetical protein